ncbi:PglL family O-oligosaccharyltransferase [Uliginosibacterium gangwonense]|uniref:PglL family O-oligosaccharyltransferase n=1 Tax=Uliginosibacterium gangwonense TaxID=392736 RepID=UPI000381CC10|nr:O-antigen ligase family protein [Uliginosibacterium gangwonense]
MQGVAAWAEADGVMKDSKYLCWAGAVLGGLVMALASMITEHTNPHTVFFAEWCMAAGCVLAWACVHVSTSDSFDGVRMGLPLWGMAAFLVVCLVRQPAPSGLGYPLYAALFLMAYGLGQRLDLPGRSEWIAGGILLCAVLQSLAGLVQLAGWNFGNLVMQKMFLQAFGNIGQANHYTDLIYLGLAALCYLRGVRAYPWPVFVGFAAWLCLAGAASASRGAWLYTAAFLLLGGLGAGRARDEQTRNAVIGLLIVAGLSVVAQLLVSYGHILSAFDVTSSLDRAGDAGSNGQRMYDWKSAVLAIQASPWWGEGPATFYKLSVDAMAKTGPVPFSKFAEHAHNLPLQLAAEFGIPFAVLLLGAMAWWYLRHLFLAPSARSIWVLASVAVTGLHSLVEYPLWYTYFLAPIALCMGNLDAQDRTLSVLRLPRIVPLVVGVLAVGVLTIVMLDWYAVRTAYVMLSESDPDVSADVSAAVQERLGSVGRYSVFSAVAEGLRVQASRPAAGDALVAAQRCDRVWQYKPAWFMMMRCGEAYAIGNNAPALGRLAMALCEGFPHHHQPLQEWAKKFDAKAVAPLKIATYACLRPQATKEVQAAE